MRIRPNYLIWITILLMSPEFRNLLERSCSPGLFDCGNRLCVAKFLVCDGDDDCSNLQDEKDCPVHKDTICGSHQIKCKDTGECIPLIWKCDGHADCTDLSDETDCSEKVMCHGGYLCPENKCISVSWRCDGKWDCEDGSDENDCDKMKLECTEHEFQCNDSTCISLAKACDFKNDCKNGEDEGNHCDRKACINMTCAHDCLLTPTGPECSCHDGYKLDTDQISCVDIDECALNPAPCSQRCFNTNGSFSCNCKTGYNLVDNSVCSVSGPSPLLLYATSHEIRGIWTRPREYFRVALTRNNAVGVSYDSVESRVYWVESLNKGGAIMVADIDGKNKQMVVTKGLQCPQDIAVDFIARNIYVTDQNLQQVLVCKIDGSVCATILTGEKPRGLAIDHRYELLYWSDWGLVKSRIYRSEMDGRNNTLFVKDDVFWPNGLSIDFGTDRLFWCEAKFERIEFITLDGKNREIVFKADRLHPYYVAVFEDTLYFSDWNKYSLESCNKRTGKNLTTLVRGRNKKVAGVHVFHPIDYANVQNPCRNESCRHLCLISRKNDGYACACSAGYELHTDGSTCISTYLNKMRMDLFTPSPPTGVCKEELNPHPHDCAKYIHCEGQRPIVKDCPKPWHWSIERKRCVWPCTAKCDPTYPCSTTTEMVISPLCLSPNEVFQDPDYCEKYIFCSKGVATTKRCPANLHFNKVTKVCDKPEVAGCHDPVIPTTTLPDTVTPCNCSYRLFPDMSDCNRFWLCQDNQLSHRSCGDGLVYNPDIENCDLQLNTNRTCGLLGVYTPIHKPDELVCKTETGVFPNVGNCRKFYLCEDWRAHSMSCPDNHHWSAIAERCYTPCEAKCDEKIICE